MQANRFWRTVFWIATLVVVIYKLYTSGAQLQSPETHFTATQPIQPKRLSISIVESNGWHDEVFTALVALFGSTTREAEITLYLKKPRYGIQTILDDVAQVQKSKVNFRDVGDWKGEDESADFLILTTCARDMSASHLGKGIKQLKDSTHLVCVFHNAASGPTIMDYKSTWEPMIAKEQVTFLGLANHTVAFLQDQMEQSPAADLYRQANFQYWVPLFDRELSHEAQPCLFAVQGTVDESRRNFTRVMEQLGHAYERNKEAVDRLCDLKLNVIGLGRAKVSVPTALKGRVSFHKDLSYPAFYDVLSESQALLPAFASDIYYSQKSSSTVPAGLIAGVPISATPETFDKYNYLDADANYLTQDTVNEVDHIISFIVQHANRKELVSSLKTMKNAVMANKAQIMQTNTELALEMVAKSCQRCFD